MERNLLAKTYDNTLQRLNELRRQELQIADDLYWYTSIDSRELTEEIQRSESTLATLNGQIEALDKEIEHNTDELREIDSVIAAANRERDIIELRVKELQRIEKQVADKLQWFNNTDPRALTEELRRNEANYAALNVQIAALERDIENSASTLRELESSIGKLYNPLNWFSKGQREFRRKRRYLGEIINKNTCQRRTHAIALQDTFTRTSKVTSDLKRYSEYDYARLKSDQEQLVASLVRANDELSSITIILRQHEEKSAHLREISIQKTWQRQSHADTLRDTIARTGKITNDLLLYNKFDLLKCKSDQEQIQSNVSQTQEELSGLAKRKQRLEEALAPLLKEMRDIDSKKRDATTDLKKAQDLDAQLTSAGNAYDRAKIHEQCELRFGTGSPRSIIHERQRMVRQCERDYDKARRRAEDIEKKASRRIDTIVIDGNNLCYEGDSTFIGIAAIEKLLPYLCKNYAVVVVFDSSIRRLLKTNDSGLQGRLAANVKVHVVASRGMADETILDLASNSPFIYVISNDRYGDFNDKSVVKEDRIIRHEIVDGKAFLHDLQVRVAFR